ncbi:MAG: hypothetical protein PHW27_12980 [Melioribacteraceae bacterium]|nr:hypothetical protein [Melioribacteraceae bacterium]
MEKIICDYCGKSTTKIISVINPNTDSELTQKIKPGWTLHFNTGKFSCPDCYKTGKKEVIQTVRNHIKKFNNKSKEK